MLTPRKVASPIWPSAVMAVLAVAGAMLGMANTDALVYAMFQKGGSAFLLMYVVCLFLVGLPVMLGWLFLGRQATVPGHAVKEAVRASKLSRWWGLLGPFWQLLAFFLLVMMAGWAGDFTNTLLPAHAGITEQLAGMAVFLGLIFLVGLCGPHWQGRINAWVMLVALLLGVVLLWQSFGEHTLGSSWHEVFAFRYALVTWHGFLHALELSLVTASIGGAALWVYASYLPLKPASLGGWALLFLGVETLIAVFLGFAAFALESGIPLQLGQGHYLYMLVPPIGLFFAGSALAEGGSAALTARNMKRPLALFLVLLVAGIVASAVLMLKGEQQLHTLLLQWLLPIAVLLMAILTGWMLKETRVRKALAIQSFPLYLVSRALLRLLVPLVVILLLVHTAGGW